MLNKCGTYLLMLFLISFESLHVKGSGECEYKHDERTFLCIGIKESFPTKYYGEFHLKCENCYIPVFSKDVFPHENSLVSFNMTGNTINNITSKAFVKFTNVQYLYLQHLGLENISADAFVGLKHVYELHLENNKIKELTPMFLNGFESNSISLSNNQLTEIKVNDFEGIIGTMSLDISNNLINKIHKDAFQYLEGLEFLSLENNKLCKLPFGLFKHLRLLKELNLSGNRLKTFGTGIFTGLRNLQHFNISRNQVAIFKPEFLLPIARLATLDISDNGIDFLNGPDLHLNVPTLRHISLNDNHWFCGVLTNLVQYFRTVNVDTYPLDKPGKYDVTNVNGIACCETVVEEKVPFEKYMKVIEHFTKKDYRDDYC